jgi:thymidylate synthase (FAD)
MEIEKYVNQYFPVLDCGFIALKNYMGGDKDIAGAARGSYGVGTNTSSSDRGLIRRLMRDRHTSPFEMCEIVFHVGLPIFVARQWVRHRTASLNEYSGRYSIMPMIFYSPKPERCQTQHKTNKQGSSSQVLDEVQYSKLAESRSITRGRMEETYRDALDVDLARELARIDLPLSMYTYWYWKIDLHNLLHFLKLRLAPDAQWEIRQYANIIAGFVKEWVPYTYEAFMDYIVEGVSFSRYEQEILWNMINSRHADISSLTNNELETWNKKLEHMKRMSVCNYEYPHGLNLSEAKPASHYEELMQRYAIQ